MSRKIQAVYGVEPPRQDEYGWSIIVGQHTTDARMPKVDRIDTYIENCGTYGIKWYVGYAADGSELMRLNALQVSAVCYAPSEEDLKDKEMPS